MKTVQIVARLPAEVVREIDQIVHQARKRWNLDITDGYRRRPTRSSVVRRLIIRSLDRDQRERAGQSKLPL